MLEAYLAFARGDVSESPRRSTCGDVARGIRPEMPSAVECDARSRVSGGAHRAVRPDAFKRCVANLVANAMRYGRRIAIAERASRAC